MGLVLGLGLPFGVCDLLGSHSIPGDPDDLLNVPSIGHLKAFRNVRMHRQQMTTEDDLLPQLQS